MKTLLCATLIVASFITCLTICSAANPTAKPISRINLEQDDGKIYTQGEVDTRAIIMVKPDLDNLFEAVSNCTDKKVELKFRLVLSRSGKVSNVKILNEPQACQLDEVAAKDFSKLEFKPALKKGQLVSQYFDIKVKVFPKKK
jgi:hypothetical protein